jgi:hypothetical protein
VLAAIAGTLLMLRGATDRWGLRSLQAVWNFGHVCLFFLWTLLLQAAVHRRFRKNPSVTLAGMALAVAAAGLAVEAIQALAGRSPDIKDALLNLVGFWAATVLFDPVASRWPVRYRLAAGTSAAVLLAWAVWPVATALVDEQVARRQFPMMAGFESALEKTRLGGGAPSDITSEQASEGRRSLKVRLTTRRHSGVALSFFPRDWRGFDLFLVDLYNPEAASLTLTCRIHDAFHENRHSDRFNRRYRLPSGWSRIAVPLADVRSAPVGREMDLSRVMAVMFFASSLPEPRTIYIDNVRLARAGS